MAQPATAPRIGLLPATAMVVGTIIGASIFVQPSEVTGLLPGTGWVLVAWLAAGLITLVGALVAAELASALPRTGGVYVYLSEAFTPAAGFLWGWAMLWVMHSGIVAAIAVVVSRYVGQFVPLGVWGGRAVAIAAIVALSAVNRAGVRYGGLVQSALTIAKVAAVMGLVALLFATPAAARPAEAGAGTGAVAAGGLLRAIGAGLFAFGGWHMVTYAAEETAAAERTIPRALLAGTLIVTACYVALNAAYLRVLTPGAIAASHGVAADAARVALGPRAASFVALIVIVSALGALNGVILAGPRVYYAMARDGLLFGWLGAVHPARHTPHRAIVLQAVWSSVLVTTGTYRQLFGRVIYTEWLFFGLMALGLIALRRRPGYRAVWRLPGGAFLPVLFAAAAFAVAGGQIAAAPRDSAVGLALVAVGLPVYAFIVRRHHPGGAGAGR